MGGVHVTRHATERWSERVCASHPREAEQMILAHSTAIQKAAAFGAHVVKLGTGHRLVLDGTTVITVYPASRFAFAA